jgi:hypothetical protein
MVAGLHTKNAIHATSKENAGLSRAKNFFGEFGSRNEELGAKSDIFSVFLNTKRA